MLVFLFNFSTGLKDFLSMIFLFTTLSKIFLFFSLVCTRLENFLLVNLTSFSSQLLNYIKEFFIKLLIVIVITIYLIKLVFKRKSNYNITVT